MRWFYSLLRKSTICLFVVAMLATNFIQIVYAEGETVDISVNATSANVDNVESLAQSLYERNTFASQSGGYLNAAPNKSPYNNTNRYPLTGLFSWDTESTSNPTNPKKRSWTYYNGIMMDAFLMLDSESYQNYVETFYNANITQAGEVAPNSYPESDSKANKYRTNELDSIPPTRALFDLIRDESVNSDKYKKMIDYVYHVMEEFTVVDNPYTGGNFVHKVNNPNWETYKIY